MRCAYCTLRLSRWGEGTVTADDYASLIDPTRLYWRSHAKEVGDPSTIPSPARGEGMVTADDYASLIDPTRPYSTLLAKPCQRGWRPLTLTLSRKGRGDCYRGRLRFANRPYSTRLDPTCPGAVGNPVEGGTLAPWRRRGMPGWHPPTTLPPLALATTMRR